MYLTPAMLRQTHWLYKRYKLKFKSKLHKTHTIRAVGRAKSAKVRLADRYSCHSCKHIFTKASQRDNMNSSAVSETKRIALACDPAIPYGFLDETTMWAYGWLIFIVLINIVACPLAAVMNALVIIAVNTKHRLKTRSNIALACLSTTDLTMGVIGQPAFIAWVIAQLQGNTSSTYCIKTVLSRLALRVLGNLTLSHLAMVHVERYIAIKHSCSTKPSSLRIALFVCRHFFGLYWYH